MQIVFATAKIVIRKQFTTRCILVLVYNGLFLPLQRQSFESNSQRQFKQSYELGYCFCHCKDSHSKAIHNTTAIVLIYPKLFLPLQRQSFESNSQQTHRTYAKYFHCFCHCKDSHSKAIHNHCAQVYSRQTIVFATAKIVIRKQFTTYGAPLYIGSDCFCHCKCSHSKAIHNEAQKNDYQCKIVFDTAKIVIRKQFAKHNLIKSVIWNYFYSVKIRIFINHARIIWEKKNKIVGEIVKYYTFALFIQQ